MGCAHCATIFASNTEAQNQTRFESKLAGSFSESRITQVHVRNRRTRPVEINAGAADGARLASPMGMALSPPGFATWKRSGRPYDFRAIWVPSLSRRLLYVAGFGSDNIGVLSDSDLSKLELIDLRAGTNPLKDLGKGPTGLVLDEERNCLYVMNRFDQSLSVVCPADRAAEAHVVKTEWLPDPTPEVVYEGRRFLYDARRTSRRGDMSCAGCHVFGDLDDLAWDLGDSAAPNTDVFNVDPFIDDPAMACSGEPCRSTRIPHCALAPTIECTKDADCGLQGPCGFGWTRFCNSNATQPCSSDAECRVPPLSPSINPANDPRRCIDARRFASFKGPMTTQSLKGMKDAGPMHWRGDRFSLANPLDEGSAFEKFNPAFVGLLGKSQELLAAEMDDFRDFVLTLRYPPNPNAPFLPVTDPKFAQHYSVELTDFRARSCASCHVLPLGTSGLSSFEATPQDMKIAHLRNQYQKVGMRPDPATGQSVRGFGFLHDGSIPSVFDFLNIELFTFPTDTPATSTTPATLDPVPRRVLERHLLEFFTDLAPIVAQQVTLGANQQGSAAEAFLDGTLLPRAIAGDCDLVVKGRRGGLWRGWLFVRERGAVAAHFKMDDNVSMTDTALRTEAQIPGQERTYTCVPPGSGARISIDRDANGVSDGTEDFPPAARHGS